MRHLRVAGLAMLALAFSSSTAFAQRSVNTGAGAGGGGFWEWGVDFISLGVGGDPSTTTFGLGSGSIRGGKFFNDAMSLEPVIGFGLLSTDNFSSNNLDIELGFLYHLQADRAQQQIFLRPALGMNRNASKVTSGGTTTKNSQSCNRFMVGAGIKRPSKKMPKLHLRGEARFTNFMECGGAPSESGFSLHGGVSIFTP